MSSHRQRSHEQPRRGGRSRYSDSHNSSEVQRRQHINIQHRSPQHISPVRPQPNSPDNVHRNAPNQPQDIAPFYPELDHRPIQTQLAATPHHQRQPSEAHRDDALKSARAQLRERVEFLIASLSNQEDVLEPARAQFRERLEFYLASMSNQENIADRAARRSSSDDNNAVHSEESTILGAESPGRQDTESEEPLEHHSPQSIAHKFPHQNTPFTELRRQLTPEPLPQT